MSAVSVSAPSAHEALVERLVDIEARHFFVEHELPLDERLHGLFRERINLVLAEVYRTLETVTPAQVETWRKIPMQHRPNEEWLAMLRASPLNPDDGKS